MADNDDKIKISELSQALNLDNTSETVVNKEVSGSWATFKMTIATLAAHILEAFSSSSFKTNNKTVVGAVNQTISNLAEDFNTTAGSTYAENDCVLYNGNLYKCTNASGTTSGTFIDADWTDVKAVDVGSGGGGGGSSTLAGLNDVNLSSPSNNQVLKYNATSHKWENGEGGGSSGDHITLTQAEYDALVEAGTVDPDAFYFIEDGSPSAYTVTTLNDTPSLFTANSEITLSDDFDKYDELRFYLCMWDSVLYNHFDVKVVPKDVLMKSWQDYNDSSISYQYKGKFELTRNLSAEGTFYASSWQVIASAKNKLLSANKGTQGWQSNLCYIYKVVGIKYSVVGGAPKHEYSTSEQIVGTWIDGTPVYEKTFDFSFASTENWVSDALGLNIDKVVYLFAYVKLGTTGGAQWITSPYIEGTNYRCDCHYQSADDKFYIKSNWSSTDAIITIRYTKSTS